MDAFFELSWRAWPSMALVLGGVVLAVRGVSAERRSLALRPADYGKSIIFTTGLRMVLLGVSLVAVGAGWLWQIVWLFWLGVVVGAEETLETTLILSALRNSERTMAARRARRARRITTAAPMSE